MPFNDNLPPENTDPWYSPLVLAWAALKVFVNGLETAIGTKASTSALTSGLAGKADLVGGLIPTSQIPAIAISDFLGAVGSQSAMLALTGEKGDWVVRTDNSTTWIITGDTPSSISSWTQIQAPSGGGGSVTSVNGKTGLVVLSPSDVGAATSAQGAKADTAVQPGALGSAASQPSSAFATAAQGTKADTAVQPGSLGSAASQPSSAFATSAQGSKADTAVQPAGLASKADLVNGVVPLSQLPAALTSTIAVVEWDGTSWADRPDATLVIWSSLAYDNTVPAPPLMTEHDIWLADKDTVVAQ